MKILDKEKITQWIKDKTEQLKAGGKRMALAAAAGLIVAVAAVYMVHLLRHYDDYSVRATVTREDSVETQYLDFQDNLLKYNRDGAFYTEYKGELIWNYTYEMGMPTAKKCGNYAMIYDKGGTQLSILSLTGVKGSIKTSLPIVDADVASNGTAAVLMQEDNVSYAELYDADGKILASGEWHGENSGFPVAIALSSDGEKLMVSLLDLREGSVKTTICFYHFGKEGRDAIDNLVASYSYADMVIPQIAFVKNDKAIAFGDKGIVLFKNDAKCKVDKELYVEDQIKSVFYNESYFGIIVDAVTEEGEQVNQMTVYSMNGFKKIQKNLEISYHQVELMENNEILVTNGKDVNIYTLQGIRKFAYTFETGIYKIIPGDGSSRYIFLESDKTEIVKLR